MRLPKLNKKTLTRLLFGAGALALVALVVLLGGLFFPEEERVLAPPLRQPEEAEYQTHPVKKGVIENTIICQGYFYPEKQSDVAFLNREGFLKAVYVQFGQLISAGQVLASLDTDALVVETRRQTLMLEEARENLARLKAIAAPEIAVCTIELEELRRDLEVKRQFGESVSQSEIKRLENQVKIKEYAHRKLELESDYRLSAAEREIEKAELTLRELELEMQKSVLRAPSAGRVIYVAPVHQGERIPPYKTMVSLADPYRLIVKYTGTRFEKFRLGMKVKVRRAGKTYSGEVVLTPLQVPSEDFEKMKETVYVKAHGLPGWIALDEAADIEATLERAEDVIVLPRRLVHSYAGRSFVKLLEDGLVNERDVKTGIESHLEIEISSGLEPGELVVE